METALSARGRGHPLRERCRPRPASGELLVSGTWAEGSRLEIVEPGQLGAKSCALICAPPRGAGDWRMGPRSRGECGRALPDRTVWPRTAAGGVLWIDQRVNVRCAM